MSGDPLVEFLLDRIAEDGAVAVICLNAQEALGPIGTTLGNEWDIARIDQSVERDHTVAVSPERLAAECDAKRRIIGMIPGPSIVATDDGNAGWFAAFGIMLRLLALPYADHPAFQETWRV